MLFKQKLEKPWKGWSGPSNPPLLQVCIFFSMNGGCLAIGNICSSNPYNSVVADDKNHRPLKCACKDGITAGCPLPWNRMPVEGKRNNQYRNQEKRDCSCWGDPPPQLLLLQASSCTRRGCVEEALLPTELILTQWSTAVGRSRFGLQFAKLE